MLAYIISILLSIGVGVNEDINLEHAENLLTEHKGEVITNNDGSYDIYNDSVPRACHLFT